MSHRIMCDRCGVEQAVVLYEGQTEPEAPPGWFDVSFLQSAAGGSHVETEWLLHCCPDCGAEMRDACALSLDRESEEEADDDSGDGDGDADDDESEQDDESEGEDSADEDAEEPAESDGEEGDPDDEQDDADEEEDESQHSEFDEDELEGDELADAESWGAAGARRGARRAQAVDVSNESAAGRSAQRPNRPRRTYSHPAAPEPGSRGALIAARARTAAGRRD